MLFVSSPVLSWWGALLLRECLIQVNAPNLRKFKEQNENDAMVERDHQ